LRQSLSKFGNKLIFLGYFVQHVCVARHCHQESHEDALFIVMFHIASHASDLLV
jgi:hypothetical protein